MRFFIYIFLLGLYLKTGAQNLVQNGSFENVVSCPSSSGQFSLVANWFNPTQLGSPDLLSTCGSGGMSLPGGTFFYQTAKHGNNIAGIWTYSKQIYNTREYLQTQLLSPLVPANFYLIKFYVNSGNWAQYSSNNIGAVLSSNQIYQNSSSNYLISDTPQVIKFNNPIITDTLEWIEVSTVYQAIGSEQFLTLGNFLSDNSTDTLNFCSNCLSPCAYYFIDDVSLENITTPQWQYRDTTVYLGDSVLIGPAVTGLNVDWYTMGNSFIQNAPAIYVKPIVNTSYKAIETFNSTVYTNTVNVTVLNPTKVNEYQQLVDNIKIYPNPVSSKFAISFPSECGTRIDLKINDISGKTVYRQNIEARDFIMPVEVDLSNGIYFLKIQFANIETPVTRKLIIQK